MQIERCCQFGHLARAALVLIASLMVPLHAAVGAPQGFGNFHHTSWTDADGAPSIIRSMAQTPDGWLWIGSSAGLFRFDGVKFERFPAAGEHSTRGVMSVSVLPDGALFVSYRFGAGSALVRGEEFIFTRGTPETDGVDQDLDGVLWGTTAGDVVRLVNGEWQVVDHREGFNSSLASDLLIDAEGTVWVGHEDGVAYLPRGGKTFAQVPMKHGEYDLVAGEDGVLWASSVFGLQRLAPIAGATNPPRVRSGPLQTSTTAVFDRQGRAWTLWCDAVCSAPPRSERTDTIPAEPATDIFSEADGLSSNATMTMLEDREGNVWVATRRGLDRFRRNALQAVQMPAGAMEFVLMAADEGDAVFAAHWLQSSGIVWRIDGEGPRAIDGIGPLITAAFRAADGEIWLGGPDGLWHGRDDRFVHVPLPADWSQERVRSIAKDSSGVWVCFNSQGLYRYEHNAWRRIETGSLPGRNPATLTVDAQGRSWFGFARQRVVAVVENGATKIFGAAQGLAIDPVAYLYTDSHVIVAGENGLALLVKDRFQTLNAADPDVLRRVSGIVRSQSGHLWFNGARGIVRVHPQEIERASADPNHLLQYDLFDSLDGLRGVAQSFYPNPTVARSADGRLWFAASAGISWLDPQQLTTNTIRPEVRVLRVHADGDTYDHAPLVALPARTHNLQIDYTALSLSIPERVQFRYRLEGVDDEWQEPGARRAAFYSNLGPGSYRFRVLASNEDGLWNEEGAAIELTIAPTFYQTMWFKVLCALTLAALLWVAYVFRLRQVTARLRARWQERLTERERIARELHDTFLQSTFALSLKVESAIADIPQDHPARNGLQQALDRADEVVAEGRRRVQELRTVETSAQHLGGALEKIGAEFAEFYPARLNVRVESQVDTLNAMVVEELLQIGREALTNAFHHANATHIEVAIACQAHATVLTIVDDGIGIDADVLASGGRAEHWGLIGMRERAQKIGARFELRTRSPSGTEVNVSVPAHLAYSREQGRLRRWLSPKYIFAEFNRRTGRS